MFRDVNMNKMRVGIVLPQSKYSAHFQLALSIIDSLLKYSSKFSYSVIYYDEDMLTWLTNLADKINLIQIGERTPLQRVDAFINILLNTDILPMTGREEASKLKKANLDLLIIPFHGLIGFMEKMPYIITLTSIMKKEFKYVSKFRDISLKNRIQAEIVPKYAARCSVLSVVDSQQGMDDLKEYFNVGRHKVRIIPHRPAGYIYDNKDMNFKTAEEILNRFDIPDKYLFYPSQLLYVKNHIRLIKALQLIRQIHGIKNILSAGRSTPRKL